MSISIIIGYLRFYLVYELNYLSIWLSTESGWNRKEQLLNSTERKGFYVTIQLKLEKMFFLVFLANKINKLFLNFVINIQIFNMFLLKKVAMVISNIHFLMHFQWHLILIQEKNKSKIITFLNIYQDKKSMDKINVGNKHEFWLEVLT